VPENVAHVRPLGFDARIRLTVAGQEVINVLIAANAAQGETNMSELINKNTDATVTATENSHKTPPRKASPGARKPRVAKPEAKSGKKATPSKKAPKAASPNTVPKPKGVRPGKAAKETSVRQGSKTEKILDLMKRSGGVTLKELTKAIGWQAHSVRGFLSVLGKKMGLTVISSKSEAGERTYRVAK
jgi:hypothetical protein